MVQYKLTYFALRGLGEMSRMLFEYSKTPYEDNRIEFADWPALKSSMPFGQMPVLEVDGKVLTQSTAIARYLARQFKLAGQDEFEEAYVDSIVGVHTDTNKKLTIPYRIIAGMIEGDKAAATKEVQGVLEERLPIYEKLLSESESGFFAKSGVTWADFYVSQGFVTMNNLIPGTFTKHPIIKQYVDRVHSLPQLKDYIAKRPVTQF